MRMDVQRSRDDSVMVVSEKQVKQVPTWSANRTVTCAQSLKTTVSVSIEGGDVLTSGSGAAFSGAFNTIRILTGRAATSCDDPKTLLAGLALVA